MNPNPGWYQDTQQPPGPPTPSSWFARHKTWTAVLVVAALAFGGSLLSDEEPVDTTSASSRDREDTLPEPEPDLPAEPASDDSDDSDEEPVSGAKAAGGPGAESDNEGSSVAAKPKPKRRTTPTFLVSRVIDGDTVELGNGETVRLVGIDTPEVGECGFEAASANLSRLVLGKSVQLGRSDENRDGYGRLLRYVDVAGTDAGMRLIKNGRAIAAYDSRDGYGFHPREPQYVASDRGATNRCPMATGQNPTPKPAAPKPKPKPQPLVGGGGCATGYDPCLPAGPDLDCPDVNGPIRVTGSDPHRLDADGEGWACES